MVSKATEIMLGEEAVSARARTMFDRNWRDWAADVFAAGTCCPELVMSLKPPRERDVSTGEAIERARSWIASWRACSLPGEVDWQRRSWSRVGDQEVPARIRIEGACDIASWAGEAGRWELAVTRVGDVARRVRGSWGAMLMRPSESTGSLLASSSQADSFPAGNSSNCAPPDALSATAAAIKASVGEWCKLTEPDWQRALGVWDWLLSHPGERRFARQLPIRGVDTKWVESHGRALRPLFRSLVGSDLEFDKPEKQFRCVACGPGATLGGCRDFSLGASQLDMIETRPRAVIISENLVNVLSLGAIGRSRGVENIEMCEGPGSFGGFDSRKDCDLFEGVLAIHGGGFAVAELAYVSWLPHVPLVYWGDLDSNGFAILDVVRGFAPHARSVMMDAETLQRHFDLCVQEDKPATGTMQRLTSEELEALLLLRAGYPSRGIVNLRLEQERVTWDWALDQLRKALG